MDKNKIGFVYSEVYFNQQWTAKLEKMVSPFYTDWDSQAFKNYLEKFNLPFDEKIKHFSRYENEIVFSTSFESPC